MKELQMILEMIEELGADQVCEARECRSQDLKYAAMYADGKAAAYNYAAKLLRVYIESNIPFET